MNVPTFALAALILAAAPAIAADSASTPVVQSLKVVDSILPIYPQDMIQMGLREGEARIAFSVDRYGRVDDCLPIAYTHPAFARSTVTALKRWKFEPAKVNGVPIAAATEIVVRYEVEGTIVVSLNAAESLNTRIQTLLDDRGDAFRPRMLKELDRIPTPIAAPSPAFPTRLKTPGVNQQVTATFYIDEQGAVRLPSVSSKDDPELGAAVVDALRNWKFEPPMCKGRTVLVRASQQFNFRAPPEND